MFCLVIFQAAKFYAGAECPKITAASPGQFREQYSTRLGYLRLSRRTIRTMLAVRKFAKVSTRGILGDDMGLRGRICPCDDVRSRQAASC